MYDLRKVPKWLFNWAEINEKSFAFFDLRSVYFVLCRPLVEIVRMHASPYILICLFICLCLQPHQSQSVWSHPLHPSGDSLAASV